MHGEYELNDILSDGHCIDSHLALKYQHIEMLAALERKPLPLLNTLGMLDAMGSEGELWHFLPRVELPVWGR